LGQAALDLIDEIAAKPAQPSRYRQALVRLAEVIGMPAQTVA